MHRDDGYPNVHGVNDADHYVREGSVELMNGAIERGDDDLQTFLVGIAVVVAAVAVEQDQDKVIRLIHFCLCLL